MQTTVNLAAGLRRQVGGQGSYFLLMATGAAASVEVWVIRGGIEVEYIRTGKRGLKLRVPGGFERIEMRSSIDAATEIVVSEGLVDIDLFDGASVLAEIANLPLLVSNDRGSPGNLLHVVGVSVADAPATAVSADAPVAVTSAGAVLLAADANRREARFLNLGPDPVAIIPPGATWAQRVIVVDVGDVWVETRAANRAWSAITDAGEAASVGVQGVTV